MIRRLVVFGVSLALLCGCGDTQQVGPEAPSPPQPQSVEQRLGEPRDGHPTYEERAVLYLTNRARTEPDAFNANEPFEPTPPLSFDLALSKAARWQAEHIIEQSCWCQDHSSCCELEAAAEGGQCAGASTSCGATSAADRVAFWSNRFTGENAARGYQNPEAAIDGWIHSSGHWQNINNARHTLLGPGHYATGWVQVFGAASQRPPVAADGIHLANQSSPTFGITYFQPTTGGPQSALVIVDGQCHTLDLAYGTPEHGAFETSVGLEAGCHRYYFHITDGQGNDHVYPSQGSLAVAVGAPDNCPLFSANRPADTCSPSGQSCETGHTRPCYTGPWGTRGVGICEAGVERCIGGQWTGECRNEVHPEPEELCDNELDDDCNGETDDGCSPQADAGTDGGIRGGRSGDTGGCSAGTPQSAPSALPPALATLVAVFAAAARRRRRRSNA